MKTGLTTSICAAAAKGYEKIRADHETDYRSLYDRVKLSVGWDEADLVAKLDSMIMMTQKAFIEAQ